MSQPRRPLAPGEMKIVGKFLEVALDSSVCSVLLIYVYESVFLR